MARALTTSGLAAFYAGDNPRAVRVLEEPVRQARAAGDRGQAGFALMYLSATALARTDWAEAVRRGGPARGDPRLPEPGPPVGPVNLPPAGRRPAAARTDHRRAVWLAAASEALRNSVATALAELDHPPLPT